MTELDAVVRAWRAQDARFAEVRTYPWGELVVDPRFPRLVNANTAKVTSRGRVDPAAMVADVVRALPHARRLAVTVFHPDEQPDLIVALSGEGGDLFFDEVYVAGASPEDGGGGARVEEIADHDQTFWSAFRETGGLFGILPATLDELVIAERDLLIPGGKRWFVVRGVDGAIEAMAALVPGPSAEIDHVVTVPSARRRGHAAALVARCVAESRAAGTQQVHLLAQAGSAGERLYRRLGFRRIGAFAGWLSVPRDEVQSASL